MTPPRASPDTLDKVEVIQRSLRCFILGLIGILTVIGLPFAVMALSSFFQVKRGLGTQWNPAQQYVVWGLATALCGLFLTVVTVFVTGMIIVLELT